MKKTFSLILLSLILGSFCFSQETNVTLKMPEKYLHPSDHIQPPTPEDDLSETPWIVFSDRNQNPVYSQPNGNQIVFEAGFLDAFYVTDLHDEWLKIKPIEQNNQISPFIGWMNYMDLLLWNHCLLINNSNLCQIAFLKKPYYTNSFESSELLLVQNINKLLNPSLPLSLFKYKTLGDSVLIGYDRYFKPTEKFTLQWVPIETVFEWNNNLVLEPNTNPESIIQRRTIVDHDTIGLIILDNYNHALDYSKGGMTKIQAVTNKFAVYTENPIVTKRHPGLINRFIVLDTMTDNNNYPKILKVGVFQRKEADVPIESERNATDFFLDVGYAIIENENNNSSDYTVSCMISDHKLNKLISMFRDCVVSKQLPESIRRYEIISGFESWCAFIKYNEERINAEIGDIFRYHGIPIDDSFYQLKLSDFSDPRAISNKTIDDLLSYFDHVLNRLEDIQSKRSIYPRLISLKANTMELFIPMETFYLQSTQIDMLCR